MEKKMFDQDDDVAISQFPCFPEIYDSVSVREARKAVSSCFCPVFASPTCGFLPSTRNFWHKCFSPLAVHACFRPQSFVISEAPFHTFAGENRSIILAGYLCSCLERLCETEQRGIRAHKHTFSAESQNDRFEDERSHSKLRKHFLNVGQIVWFYATRETNADLLQGPIKTC